MKAQHCKFCGEPLERCEDCSELFCTTCDEGWQMDDNGCYVCPVCVMEEYRDMLDNNSFRSFTDN